MGCPSKLTRPYQNHVAVHQSLHDTIKTVWLSIRAYSALSKLCDCPSKLTRHYQTVWLSIKAYTTLSKLCGCSSKLIRHYRNDCPSLHDTIKTVWLVHQNRVVDYQNFGCPSNTRTIKMWLSIKAIRHYLDVHQSLFGKSKLCGCPSK
ncbi:hypothetical protein CEXT_758331 [Caerostris extrusa]|uniref:Uncharacterized protein n=1 Tax=Caerostris extrusa TaxID=172846 RepID=A0AAV4Y6W0_CAEEX|nr:hypothetical protein CEXT_758331 [Caerostris extrusa]